MPANNPSRQRGVAAVEFALVVIIFLTLLFGIIELARSMYVFNTLKEVTRRAANGTPSPACMKTTSPS